MGTETNLYKMCNIDSVETSKSPMYYEKPGDCYYSKNNPITFDVYESIYHYARPYIQGKYVWTRDVDIGFKIMTHRSHSCREKSQHASAKNRACDTMTKSSKGTGQIVLYNIFMY